MLRFKCNGEAVWEQGPLHFSADFATGPSDTLLIHQVGGMKISIDPSAKVNTSIYEEAEQIE